MGPCIRPVPGLGLVRVPAVPIHRGDHSVRGDLSGDPEPPVGPVGTLGRFHVLPESQGWQRVLISDAALQRFRVGGGQPGQRIGNQGGD